MHLMTFIYSRRHCGVGRFHYLPSSLPSLFILHCIMSHTPYEDDRLVAACLISNDEKKKHLVIEKPVMRMQQLPQSDIIPRLSQFLPVMKHDIPPPSPSSSSSPIIEMDLTLGVFDVHRPSILPTDIPIIDYHEHEHEDSDDSVLINVIDE